MYHLSQSNVHTLAVLIFLNLEHEFQGNIGVEMISSGHHQGDSFLNLHTGSDTDFWGRRFLLPRLRKSQEGEDVHKQKLNWNTNRDLKFQTIWLEEAKQKTHDTLIGLNTNNSWMDSILIRLKQSHKSRKSHTISRLANFLGHDLPNLLI